jgi:hypothetical protein
MQLRKDEVVFTKHARERLKQRQISEEMILKAIEMPYQSYVQKDGGMKFICRINGRNVHVVSQPLPEERKWLVKTVWVRGEDDEGNVVNHSDRKNASSLPMLIILLVLIIIIMAIAFWYFYTGGF